MRFKKLYKWFLINIEVIEAKIYFPVINNFTFVENNEATHMTYIIIILHTIFTHLSYNTSLKIDNLV